MPVEITWIGHATFRLSDGRNVLWIDPWKVPSEPHDADVVFVSHDHHDHCSAEDVAKVWRADTVLIAPASAVQKLGAVNAVSPGDRVTVKDVTIDAVAAYNIGKSFHPHGHHWCGAVITLGGKRIYYAGDTDLIPEMSDLKDVDLALLPVGGTYTLDSAQAARACQAIAPALAVPYHWGDIVGSRRDAEAFAMAAACEVRVLDPGGKLTI